MLVEPILADLEFSGGDGVIAFVNGMGGTPAARALPDVQRGRRDCSAKAGVTVARSLVGSYITSLDMAGCSVTLLKRRRRAAAPVGRSGQDVRRCAGES